MYKIDKNGKTECFHILLYVAFVILMIFVLFSKANLHVDEVYTYLLANSACNSALFDDGVRYEPTENVFRDNLTVNDSRRFDYGNVWKYQENDSHPPLYYALIHTVCSFFPDNFSIWYAGVINVIFALLMLFSARRMILLLTGSKLIRDLLSAAFILSAGFLSAISFLRMYIMAMFFVTWISCLIIREIGKESSWRFYVSIYFSLLFASLTHYYCIAYVAFLSITFGIYLVTARKWKAIGAYCGTVIASLASASLIFPPMLRNIFFSNRGRDTINNLIIGTDPIERLVKYYSLLNQQLFGRWLGYILLSIAFGALCVWLQRREQKTIKQVLSLPKQGSKESDHSEVQLIVRFIVLIIPSVLYFILISKTAPFESDRYIFPIYAVSFVWVLSLVCYLAKKIFDKKVFIAVVCILLGLITSGSLQSSQWPHLHKETDTLLEKASLYPGTDCVCIYNHAWKTQPAFYEISNYKSVTFIGKDNLELLRDDDIQSEKEIIVTLIDIENKDEMIEKIFESCPSLEQYEEIGSYAYGKTYYFYCDTELD